MEILVATRVKVDVGDMARLGLAMIAGGRAKTGKVDELGVVPAAFDPGMAGLGKAETQAALVAVAELAVRIAVSAHVQQANRVYLEGQQAFAQGGLKGDVAGALFVEEQADSGRDAADKSDPGAAAAELDRATSGTTG